MAGGAQRHSFRRQRLVDARKRSLLSVALFFVFTKLVHTLHFDPRPSHHKSHTPFPLRRICRWDYAKPKLITTTKMKSFQAVSLLVVALIGSAQGQNTVRGGDHRVLQAAGIFGAAVDVAAAAASDSPSDVPSDVPSDAPSYVPTAV